MHSCHEEVSYFKILLPALFTKIRHCAVPENIHTPPTEEIGNSWGVGAFQKTQKFKEMYMYEVELEFPEGRGDLIKNPFHGGGMDISWNYTFTKINVCREGLIVERS